MYHCIVKYGRVTGCRPAGPFGRQWSGRCAGHRYSGVIVPVARQRNLLAVRFHIHLLRFSVDTTFTSIIYGTDGDNPFTCLCQDCGNLISTHRITSRSSSYLFSVKVSDIVVVDHSQMERDFLTAPVSRYFHFFLEPDSTVKIQSAGFPVGGQFHRFPSIPCLKS